MMDRTMGMVFALASDEEQANMLNAAGHMMHRTFGGRNYEEMQACRIAQRLDPRGKAFILLLAEFLRDET